jgi:hypothetical protein
MHYVAWQHSDDLVRAYVPSLDLNIVKQGKIDAKFVGQIRKEIKSCLLRTRSLSGVSKLVYIENSGPLSIVESPHEVSLPSARDVAKEEPRARFLRFTSTIEFASLRTGSQNQIGKAFFLLVLQESENRRRFMNWRIGSESLDLVHWNSGKPAVHASWLG